ncbi:alpha/beta fold hydrolase [Streptomyces sp. NPDC001852]|uniref:alpha/beta fold hydrolase n=1 Tax=Streptomyces sp. NPDC001852 TaxID=3364619 RepID=UPI0036959C45
MRTPDPARSDVLPRLARRTLRPVRRPRRPRHARHGHLLASNRHDAWEALPAIVVPTLILHGDQDRLAPVDNLPLLAARIPDARTHVFPGARHAYFEECRPVASAIVTAFLEGGVRSKA